jgi:hypothetical protein
MASICQASSRKDGFVIDLRDTALIVEPDFNPPNIQRTSELPLSVTLNATRFSEDFENFGFRHARLNLAKRGPGDCWTNHCLNQPTQPNE